MSIYFKESGEHFYITSGSAEDNRVIRSIMELTEFWPVWVDREYYPSKQYVPASNEEFRVAFNKIIDTHNAWASDDYVEFGP